LRLREVTYAIFSNWRSWRRYLKSIPRLKKRLSVVSSQLSA